MCMPTIIIIIILSMSLCMVMSAIATGGVISRKVPNEGVSLLFVDLL